MNNSYSNYKQKIFKYTSIIILSICLLVSFYHSVKIIFHLKKTYKELRDLLSIFPQKNYKILHEDLKSLKEELKKLSKDGVINVLPSTSFDFYSFGYPLIPLEMAEFDPMDKPMRGVYLSYDDSESMQTLSKLNLQLVKKSNYFIVWTY